MLYYIIIIWSCTIMLTSLVNYVQENDPNLIICSDVLIQQNRYDVAHMVLDFLPICISSHGQVLVKKHAVMITTLLKLKLAFAVRRNIHWLQCQPFINRRRRSFFDVDCAFRRTLIFLFLDGMCISECWKMWHLVCIEGISDHPQENLQMVPGTRVPGYTCLWNKVDVYGKTFSRTSRHNNFCFGELVRKREHATCY